LVRALGAVLNGFRKIIAEHVAQDYQMPRAALRVGERQLNPKSTEGKR
jgi:hypothetical protein